MKEEMRYIGYFLMDSGLRVKFDISEAEDVDDKFFCLYEGTFNWKYGDTIWLGEKKDCYILVNKIAGFSCKECEE